MNKSQFILLFLTKKLIVILDGNATIKAVFNDDSDTYVMVPFSWYIDALVAFNDRVLN